MSIIDALPPVGICSYLIECYKRDIIDEEIQTLKIKHNAYIAECMWVLAVGRHFIDENKEPTLPRWSDFINPKKEETPQISKEYMKDHLRSLKRK